MSSAGAVPHLSPFSHVFVIVMENTGYAQAIGNPNLPTLNALAQQYGLATNYTGVAHPSLPNYVAMISGSTFGSHSDDTRQSFKGDNLALQLEGTGRAGRATFRACPASAGTVEPRETTARSTTPLCYLPTSPGRPCAARTS